MISFPIKGFVINNVFGEYKLRNGVNYEGEISKGGKNSPAQVDVHSPLTLASQCFF